MRDSARNFSRLLVLPTSLIALLCSLPHTQAEPWPYNLAPHERYYPEHEPHIKRELEIQQLLGNSQPAGMRKMSGDEGEKFFLDYWQFTDPMRPADERADVLEKGRPCYSNMSLNNSSSICELLPPVLPHSDKQPSSYLPRIFGRSLFERDFQCPSGTSSCTSINQPDTCCATGETCISVQDTGSGPVGCCPAGETCGGEVTGCDTAAGYTSCPGSSNGGCCIPGYTCQGVGCVYTGSSTTTTTLPVTTVTTGDTTIGPFSTTVTSDLTSQSVHTVTTTIVSTPPASTGVTTVTQTIVISPSTSSIPSTTPTSTSTTPTAFVCTSGYHSCPASLGGGCCPTDRSCATDRLCLATSTSTTSISESSSVTSTGSPGAPVRPTSGSGSSSQSSASSVTSSITYSGCPTGFYMCSAYYLGGCCRVGRNCDTSSCPSGESTSVVVTSGLTIVAGGTDVSSVSVITSTSTTTPGVTGAASSSATASQGSCASGWFSCMSDVGGGCCPNGFICGASCTATVSGQSNIGKENPSAGIRGRVLGWGMLSLGFISGVGMLVL